MKKDMTQGNPMTLILSFTVPLLIGNLFQQFYNMADAFIVSQTIGVTAFSAIGSTLSLQFLILGLAIGLTAGLAVITSQRFGAGDEKGLRRNLAASMIISVVVGVVLTLVTTLFTSEILSLMQTPEETYTYAYEYLSVMFMGIGAILTFNLLSNILRAIGDSKTPLYFLILTSILNIVLDYVFILGFNMGIRGAAVATVTSQIVSSILCLVFIWKKVPLLRIHKEDWKVDWAEYKEHLRIGLPHGFQYSIIAIGSVAITVTLNRLGATPVAAYTAAQKIDAVAILPLQSFGIAMSTYTAQNYGARKLNRIWFGVNQAVKLAISYSIFIGIVLILWGRQLSQLFLGTEASGEVVTMVQQYFWTNASLFAVLSLLFIYRHTLQGLGNSLAPTVAGVGELVARILAATLLSIPLGFLGAAISNPLAWFGAFIPLWIAYRGERRRLSGRAAISLDDLDATVDPSIDLRPQRVR